MLDLLGEGIHNQLATTNQKWRENIMNTMLLKLYVKFQDLASREEGQDLVEYALVVALIAFGATVGMKSLATGLNTAFSNISVVLGSYTS
jgi:pilus assembly protein Flp/PilA